MKNLVFTLLASLAVLFSFGQEQGKFRVGLDLGAGIQSDGAGVYGNLELKYNIKENMNVGLQFGLASLFGDLELEDDNDFESGLFTAHNTYFATYDYYFVLGNKFNPYVGAGLGLAQTATVLVYDGEDVIRENIDPYSSFGGMLRGGFEAGKFRFTLQYDFIPDNPAQDIEGRKLGEVSNNFFGIAVGFYVGGGKWGY